MGNDVSALFVVTLGLVTVFVGLACIILLCYGIRFLSSAIERLSKKDEQEAPAAESAAVADQNRQELVAVIAAVLAEEMGTDVEGLRIRSIRRV